MPEMEKENMVVMGEEGGVKIGIHKNKFRLLEPLNGRLIKNSIARHKKRESKMDEEWIRNNTRLLKPVEYENFGDDLHITSGEKGSFEPFPKLNFKIDFDNEEHVNAVEKLLNSDEEVGVNIYGSIGSPVEIVVNEEIYNKMKKDLGI